ERCMWSKSRLSHQLDRMADRGLVERQADSANSRAVIVVLTALGRRTIEQAAPYHLESVRRHFIDLLTEEQIDALGDAAEVVIAHLKGLDDAEPSGRRTR